MSTDVSGIKQPIEIIFQGKCEHESWEMDVAKVDIDVVNLPLKIEKRTKNKIAK